MENLISEDRIMKAVCNQYASNNFEIALQKMIEWSDNHNGKSDLVIYGKKYMIDMKRVEDKINDGSSYAIGHGYAWANAIMKQIV